LEGTWVVVSVMEDGKDNDKAQGAKMTFKGMAGTVEIMGRSHKGTVKVDPKKKTIDLTPDDKTEKTAKGIYRLKGDELKLCFARQDKERPKDFTAEKGSGRILMVLKRAKSE
jgi:uncharacterized protein (TIGR03067 family)